ncbi:MAG: nuclear transport factor 2 family protein [Acidimicrobiales bacterium]|nr:nuclear transport factor 2 family protein [Actinomycetota bacterium]
MAHDRAEIQAAFDRYQAAANEAGRTGDWAPWVACFTPDVHYVEHLYGEFHGREAVLAWITETMSAWPFTEMQLFPWDWYTIDAEQGWVVGQVENRFVDPGDGKVYEGANWTRLVYAGDGLFASEEDVYNPAHFGPVVAGWLEAWRTHHPDQPDGPQPAP